jgi:4-hydroxy-3-methylbut-2-enyl diphosphate reductase
MQVKLAQNYGFCFGVQRAIDMAEQNPNSATIGPLIHNYREINRLNNSFSINTIENIEELKNTKDNNTLIIRTHGIQKNDFKTLEQTGKKIINATCPFVTKPQEICEQMSNEGYQIIIYGDEAHPEVQGVKSYGKNVLVVSCVNELKNVKLKRKMAIISQTTKKIAQYLEITNYLISQNSEVRVFNTICNATSENQDSAYKLSNEVDVMIIIGGKNSSNTKQLFEICKINCKDSYLIESKENLEQSWFNNKTLCGVTAGASTPKWIINEITKEIKKF